MLVRHKSIHPIHHQLLLWYPMRHNRCHTSPWQHMVKLTVYNEQQQGYHNQGICHVTNQERHSLCSSSFLLFPAPPMYNQRASCDLKMMSQVSKSSHSALCSIPIVVPLIIVGLE